MPFPKGKSGNPGGRAKKTAEVLEVEALAKTLSPEAIQKLADWMRSDNPKASVSACNAILDRGHGKPKQAMEHTGPDGRALALSWLPPSA